MEFYYVVEHREKMPVRIFRINVGVRRTGLNNAVRSLMAFSRFELARHTAHTNKFGMWSDRPFSFDVKSQSQYEMLLERDVVVFLCSIEKPIVECADVKELYAHIGYDKARKAYTPRPTLDT